MTEDMEYCNILLEKLVNPHTPPEQIKPLLRELMDSLVIPEMKDLVKEIIVAGDQTTQTSLIYQFKNFPRHEYRAENEQQQR